jgi:hypothetical protein
VDISKERRKALKQAYKEKAAEEELRRRIRNLDDFRRLWRELVPAAGPADSLQGELLRAVENLRDESCRNGNRNFGLRHLEQCRLLTDTLNNWPDFTSDTRNTFGRLIAQIETAGRNSIEYEHLSARERRSYKKPTDCTDQVIYDLLLETFTDFAVHHTEKIPFTGYPKVELPAPPPLSPSGLMDKWVKDLFNQYCKPLGYKRDGANFRLIQPDGLGKIINFQRNRYNTVQSCSFTINVGVYFEKSPTLKNLKFKEYECLARSRPKLSAPDPWWTIETGSSPEVIWLDLEKSFSEAILPWFHRFPSKQDTLDALINDLAQGHISMPVLIAERLAACGCGVKLLPILKSERFLQKNFRHKQEIIGLIEQIEEGETRWCS